jgi:hypothetical protein
MLPARPSASRVLAVLGSLLLPGAVHIAYGQRIKGIVLLVSACCTCWGFGLIPLAAAIDAAWIAGRLAAGHPVRPSQSSPLLEWIHQLIPDDAP